MTFSNWVLCEALTLRAFLSPDAAGGQAPIPLGHREFYPSAERPVGWRGDGTGAWPGATPVAAFNGETGKNIVWKVPMAGPSFRSRSSSGTKSSRWPIRIGSSV